MLAVAAGQSDAGAAVAAVPTMAVAAPGLSGAAAAAGGVVEAAGACSSPLAFAKLAVYTHSPAAADNAAAEDACKTFTCVGGTLLGGSDSGCLQPCKQKKMGQGLRHARSQVCTVHHDFIKCESCAVHVHEGCFVRTSNGYSLPKRGFPWMCMECTLAAAAAATAAAAEAAAAVAELKLEMKEAVSLESDCGKKKCVTKCFFISKESMLQHMRDMRWRCRGSNSGASGETMYYDCGVRIKGGLNNITKGTCTASFACKSKDSDQENGDWCAINMPNSHECRGPKALALPVTTRVCNLPIDVFQDIQRLACSKAFMTTSIQVFIKHRYALVVDTALLYNIGYRARRKLGIGDMERLLDHQKVTVYTFPALYFNLTQLQARQALGDTFELVFHVVEGESRLK